MFSRIVQFISGSSLKLPLFWQAVGHEHVDTEKYRFEGNKRPYLKLLWQVTLSGAGMIRASNNRPVELPKGASFLVQFPSDHVYYYSKKNTHWEFAYIILSGPAMPQLLERIRNRPVCIFNRPLDPRIEQIVLRMVDDYKDGIGDDWNCMAEAAKVLSLLLKEATQSEERIQTNRRLPQDPDILAPIVKNPGLTIDKSGWAHEKGQSRFQLYRQVKVKTGLSPKDVRNQQRVKEAVRFLRKENLTMKDISTLSGFKDQAYFCRFFKKQTGFTPTQWRQQFGSEA
jgi:AraC-like DNA-binding protein